MSGCFGTFVRIRLNIQYRKLFFKRFVNKLEQLTSFFKLTIQNSKTNLTFISLFIKRKIKY